MGNLSQPFDPAVHVPWDCLDSLMVSVEGCMVSMVSTVPMSETLYNFSCTWLQLQGNLMNGESTCWPVVAWGGGVTYAIRARQTCGGSSSVTAAAVLAIVQLGTATTESEHQQQQ
jgi:hypothetical protein